MENDWLPGDIAFEKAKIEDLKFVFSQAKDRVSESTKEGEIIYTKSITIVSLTLTAIVALSGYIFVHLEATPLIFSDVVTLILLWVISGMLKNNILPSPYRGIGSHPKDLFVDEIFNEKRAKDSEWLLYYNEIIMYERRLTDNNSSNTKRNGRLKKAYSVLYSIPIVFISCYFFFLLLFYCISIS